MEASLFNRLVCSDICPSGTRILFKQANNQTKTFGYVQDDDTISGMNWCEIRAATGFDARQTANRLHFVPPDETRAIGMSAAFARVALADEKLPAYILKLKCAYDQQYMDYYARNTQLTPVRSATYSHKYPDNHIYDRDHIIPRCMGGGDNIENACAIHLVSHRIKSNLESDVLREVRSKCAVKIKKQSRYFMRTRLKVNYVNAIVSVYTP